MKIVINKCYGGFSLSSKCVKRYYELKGQKAYFFKDGMMDKDYTPVDEENNNLFITAFSIPNPNEIDKEKLWDYHLDNRLDDRTDPLLIQAIEEIGEGESSGSCAQLKIIEIPDGMKYEIEEYDGIEWVAEEHQTWG